jgi:hypothetical protein
MRRTSLIVITLTALTAGCANDTDAPADGEFLTAPAFSNAPVGRWQSHATGSEEVPAVDTRAQGQANFWLSSDGSELHYRLNVANIEDVVQSHIHMAPAGVSGPIVVWLYPPAPPSQLIPGRFQGVLEAGVITEANLMGPLAGMTLDALLDAIRSGNAYVNVHTLAHPPGEIRGQVH